jgi:hypothetical protein
MSNFLRIGRDSNLYLDGVLVNTQEVKNLNEYLMGFLALNVTLEDGIVLSELLHSLYGLKQYVSAYHLEEYEALRAFTSIGKFNKPYKSITFSKAFTIESDDFVENDETKFLCITPIVTLNECEGGDLGYEKIGDIPVLIDEKMKLEYNEYTTLELKTKFTLQDVIACLYEELFFKIKNENIISPAI